MTKFTSVLLASIAIVGFVFASAPAGATVPTIIFPNVHGACLVYTAFGIPHTSAVGCVAIEAKTRDERCSRVQGGNGTHNGTYFVCSMAVDWNMTVMQAGNPFLNMTAEFLVNGTRLDSEEFLTPLKERRVSGGPSQQFYLFEGNTLAEVPAELCVYNDAERNCTSWTIATFTPDPPPK